MQKLTIPVEVTLKLLDSGIIEYRYDFPPFEVNFANSLIKISDPPEHGFFPPDSAIPVTLGNSTSPPKVTNYLTQLAIKRTEELRDHEKDLKDEEKILPNSKNELTEGIIPSPILNPIPVSSPIPSQTEKTPRKSRSKSPSPMTSRPRPRSRDFHKKERLVVKPKIGNDNPVRYTVPMGKQVFLTRYLWPICKYGNNCHRKMKDSKGNCAMYHDKSDCEKGKYCNEKCCTKWHSPVTFGASCPMGEKCDHALSCFKFHEHRDRLKWATQSGLGKYLINP